MVLLAPFIYTTNMWAVLDYDEETVITCIPPDATAEEVNKWLDGRTTILMTVENSPAYVGGKYKNGKFYEQRKD